ncbi:adenosine kinase [Stappia sp. ES.058]|uniref:adenosine kinase n=1 Tax=Stappia sp. ES.058 TaxID=1881061 RepID=UPI00087B31B1|nr:adenosine kinase [Stappia sp. ES.058]SDU46680.1 Sugar or nucleoside kinase, ribokinase family [Stappia sp. ES.058]
MTRRSYDALCIGNAICDVFSHVEEDFLVQENLVKGSMRLIDTKEAVRLYERMGQTTRISGGSAGNTAAGIAALGGQTAYFGKVHEDELGTAYRHDMRGTGVHFETPALVEGPPTARSMILITPDGERTMNTFLGACVELSESDIEPETVAASAITYMEGYLWDPPAAKAAFLKAAEIAHANHRKVSLTLSDSFCVDRYRGEFLQMMRDGTIDVLFANEHELKALYETADLDTAITSVRNDCPLTALTLGEKGAMAITREKTVQVGAEKIDDVVDLTGAGDLFAAGFLLGLSRDYDHRMSAELGCLCAAEVIRHVGARPERSLRQVAEQQGFAI